ncbi:hypothetical protein [Achromobacter denitrificans]|uniref:hypothetical protein n=1 Tax=Achromobacter denitrificans TaxID=32002 RepID=UPI000B48F432|nr:hypothetical protein [Achromobacter denitrificans]
MQTTIHEQPGLADPMQRLNALAAEALAQYHAEIRAGGEPHYPSWVDDVAAVADELTHATGPTVRNSLRYLGLRDAMTRRDSEMQERARDALVAMGVDPDLPPTAAQVDAAFDAALVIGPHTLLSQRYLSLRAAVTRSDGAYLQRVREALDAMGLKQDGERLPTAEQVDSAFDAALAAEQSDGEAE